jgi:decaprenylphospho-beta-D-erythro-pentofuranosid-2-ulose 2-reductase
VRDATGTVGSVLVLGAGSEIAQATVRRLVRAGARRAVLAARRPDELAAFAAELRALGAVDVRALGFDADALDSHDRFADAVFEQDDLDLVLIAFGVLGHPTSDPDDRAAAVAVAHTTFLGALSAILACARRLDSQGHGTIVVLSSVAGERVRASNLVYGAAKAGLDGLAQGLADRLRDRGVRVMVVRPGFVHSRMTAGLRPAPFATTPDAVARAIVRGLARGSEIVWAPPALRPVMTVVRHLPRGVWRRIA